MTAPNATGPRAFVIGWPVDHSRSPLIHGHWLAEHGLPGSYDRVPVAPEHVAAFFANLPTSGFVGGNVTVPHKEAAFMACHQHDPRAIALGAVNTVWLEGGRVMGANTDVEGFLANLDEAAHGWDRDPGRAVVIGAGGAARAVVYGLVERGFDVVVVNRTVARAEAVADAFGPKVTAFGLDVAELYFPEAKIVVNTTSMGMAGKDDMTLSLDRLSPRALVTDIVYVPLETPFLKAAKARGNRTVDGLGMLLHQAVPGFEKWFGVRPVVTPALRELVLADIASPKERSP